MRFGKTLRNSIYEPWRSQYLDYAKLKRLLRENELHDGDAASNSEDQAQQWTEEDESVFVEELLNVQLEKVNAFHADTLKQLRERASECETKLEKLAGSAGADGDHRPGENHSEVLGSIEEELDR